MADGIGFDHDCEIYVAALYRSDGCIEYVRTFWGIADLERIIIPLEADGYKLIRMFKL